MDRTLVVLDKAQLPPDRTVGFRPGAKVLVQVHPNQTPVEGELPLHVDYDFLPGRVSVVVDGKMRFPRISQVELAPS